MHAVCHIITIIMVTILDLPEGIFVNHLLPFFSFKELNGLKRVSKDFKFYCEVRIEVCTNRYIRLLENDTKHDEEVWWKPHFIRLALDCLMDKYNPVPPKVLDYTRILLETGDLQVTKRIIDKSYHPDD